MPSHAIKVLCHRLEDPPSLALRRERTTLTCCYPCHPPPHPSQQSANSIRELARTAAVGVDESPEVIGFEGLPAPLPHAILVENDQHCRDAQHRDCQAALQDTRHSIRTGIDCLTSTRHSPRHSSQMTRHSPRPKAERSDAVGTTFVREMIESLT